VRPTAERDVLADVRPVDAELRRALEPAGIAVDRAREYQPLRALWEYSTDRAGTVLTMEFAGLANHRKAVRAEIARYAEKFRAAQLEALSSILDRYGLSSDDCPPVVMTVLLTGLSRVVAMEQTIGISIGHTEALDWVERHLQQLEGDPRPRTDDR
jgi:hypothetical protein